MRIGGARVKRLSLEIARRLLFLGKIAVLLLITIAPGRSQTKNYDFNDSHFHLTNNIQEGPDIHDFLNMMETKAGRVALFGVPLQQQWSYRIDGDRAQPTTCTLTLRCTTTHLRTRGSPCRISRCRRNNKLVSIP
jgi:hypothetical protein